MLLRLWLVGTEGLRIVAVTATVAALLLLLLVGAQEQLERLGPLLLEPAHTAVKLLLRVDGDLVALVILVLQQCALHTDAHMQRHTTTPQPVHGSDRGERHARTAREQTVRTCTW